MYIQVSNQDIRDQKQMQKYTKISKAKKNYTELERVTKVCAKGYTTFPPSHINLTKNQTNIHIQKLIENPKQTISN